MTLVNNAFSAQKTNLYRSNVGQAPISFANDQADSPANYCVNMVNIQTAVPERQPGAAGHRELAGAGSGQ